LISGDGKKGEKRDEEAKGNESDDRGDCSPVDGCAK